MYKAEVEDGKRTESYALWYWVLDKEKDIKIECYVMDNVERVLSLR